MTVKTGRISRSNDAFARREFILQNPSRLVLNPPNFGDGLVPRDMDIDTEHWNVMETYVAAVSVPLNAGTPPPNPLSGSQEVPTSRFFRTGPKAKTSGATLELFETAKVGMPERTALVLAPRSMTITVGRGELLQFQEDTSKVSVSDPAIADAVVVSEHDVVLNGKSPGNTTIMVWHGENVSPYQLTVEPDLSVIQKQLRAAFPQEEIFVSSSKDAILLTGKVSDAGISDQAAAIAGAHAKSVVNLLQAPPAERRQVMLQVKFAMVDRVSLSQVGVNLFSLNNKLVGGSSTQQFQPPRLGQLQLTPGADGQPELGGLSVGMSDLLNLFLFRPDINVGAVVRLLQSKNLLEILAEPNLITVSGREASFMAGGKFPYPVISSTGSSGQTAPVVTLQFQEFGIRLSFTPTVQPDGVIRMKVRPEVSSLDYANAITLQGFLIPAISTREVETEVDLREGETFAIAGLIDNRVTQVVNKIPGFGDLPILGHLFRSRDTKKSQSELLVLTTPSFVKPIASGEPQPLPRFPERFLDTTRPGEQPAPPPPENKFPGRTP